MVKKAVILCGGLATRLLPATKVIPKEIMPILNRPALDLIVEDLKNCGITDILIILGRNKECLENYFERNVELENRLEETGKNELIKAINAPFENVNIYFKRQLYAKGTAYAMLGCENFVGGDDFILIFPDELLFGESQTKQLLEEFEKTKISTIPLQQIPIEDCSKYGMVACIGNGKSRKLTKIVEKPATPAESPSDLCNLGGGVFTNKIFKYLKNCKPHGLELLYTDAIEEMMKKEGVNGLIITGERHDIGNPLGFVKANIAAALHDKKLEKDMKEYIKELAKNL